MEQVAHTSASRLRNIPLIAYISRFSPVCGTSSRSTLLPVGSVSTPQVGHASMVTKTGAKKQEDEYDFVFEDTIDFVSQEVLQQKLR